MISVLENVSGELLNSPVTAVLTRQRRSEWQTSRRQRSGSADAGRGATDLQSLHADIFVLQNKDCKFIMAVDAYA